ncbi:putative reverse transcriptase domain-containing protein [Tanacetum coccineum]
MPSYFHKKFCWGTVFATGHRSFIEPGTGFRMKRTNHRTRVPIGLYPCHIEEKMTIKEVKGESVMEWKTKLTTEEEVEENEGLKEVWEKMEYVISDSDSDLESTTTMLQEYQIENIIPHIVTQVTDNVNNRNGGIRNGRNNGCSYKTFTACNPKEFDGKGGAVALTSWIEKLESVFDNNGCTANQRVRYAASCFVNKALTWWNTQVQARGREVAIGMSWNDFKALLVEEFCPSNEMEKLIFAYQEVVRCGTLTKGNNKRKETNESSKKWSTWKDNKKSKTGSGFVVTVPPRNHNVSTYPKCAKCYPFYPENAPCKLCYNCQKPGHYERQCWAPIRQVVPVNAVRMGQNQRACYECGSLDHFRNDYPKWKQATGQARNLLTLEGNRNTQNNGNQARGRAFNGNAVEALQDPKVITGTFSLNNQFATVLFDYGAKFSFISTKFMPLLNVEPCIVNPGYVIEIADGENVEVDRNNGVGFG